MTISAEYDLSTDCFHLIADSHGRKEPAGPRLFRAAPHPAIEFSYPEQAEAETAVGLLQHYLDNPQERRRSKKTEAMEIVDEAALERAWWKK